MHPALKLLLFVFVFLILANWFAGGVDNIIDTPAQTVDGYVQNP